MPPRRGVGIGRGKPEANAILLDEIRHIRTRMETLDISQRRAPNEGDVKAIEETSEEEEAVEDEAVKFFKILAKVSGKLRIEIPSQDGNLNVDELMDQISSMDKFFDLGEIEDKKKVKYATTKLKGHASIWWDELQTSKVRKGKPKIKQWDKMIRKLKKIFMPKDYQLDLFKQLQNLRQKGMIVKEYTEEFYKLRIRVGHVEDDMEKVSRYIN